MTGATETRCPDCQGRTPNLQQHQAGCSRYQARVAAAREARRPRDLTEVGRDAQIVAVAYDLRTRVPGKRLPVPTDDQCLAWAVKVDVDDPEVLRLAHALYTSRVTNHALGTGARMALCEGHGQANLFTLLGMLAPAADGWRGRDTDALPDALLAGR